MSMPCSFAIRRTSGEERWLRPAAQGGLSGKRDRSAGGETGDGYQIGINRYGTHCGKPYGHVVRPGDLINLYI